MKTFGEFQEAAAAVKALPSIVKAFTKIAPMVAPKLKTFAKFSTAVPVGLTAAGTIMQVKKKSKGDEKLREIARQQGLDLTDPRQRMKAMSRSRTKSMKGKVNNPEGVYKKKKKDNIQDEFSAPTNSDWREELSEGAKTRLVVKGLKAIKSVIKKGGRKITRDVGSIGGTKAAGRLNVDPELIKQFPGVNLRKLAYPDYKANRNPRLAKAIRIAKDKIERAKIAISSPSADAKQLISKKEVGEYVPPTKDISKKIRDILDKLNDKKNLKDSYVYEEGAMAAPTNNVGGGKIAGTVEAGDNPPVKKKKGKKNRYIYGGRGSRKMWMK